MLIDAFTAQFFGGVRPNLFQVFVASWEHLKLAAIKVPFTCKAASLPGRTVEPMEVNIKNKKFFLPGDVTFTDFTITVMNDQDFAIRRMFETWQEKIVSNQYRGALSPREYTSDIYVIQMNSMFLPIEGYILKNAWPTQISDIPLNYDDNNKIEEFTISFKYTHYEKGITAIQQLLA